VTRERRRTDAEARLLNCAVKFGVAPFVLPIRDPHWNSIGCAELHSNSTGDTLSCLIAAMEGIKRGNPFDAHPLNAPRPARRGGCCAFTLVKELAEQFGQFQAMVGVKRAASL
jgi:hypothetical protein